MFPDLKKTDLKVNNLIEQYMIIYVGQVLFKRLETHLKNSPLSPMDDGMCLPQP